MVKEGSHSKKSEIRRASMDDMANYGSVPSSARREERVNVSRTFGNYAN